jgi:2-phosphosulfolactate phosphatase
MKLDVVFTPAALASHAVAGRPVFVIDILRTTTVIVAALFRGARVVVPVPTVEEATRLVQSLGTDAVVTVGERHGTPIEGFNLDNSPVAMTEERVRGKTVVMTTTNGVPALLATQGASEVYIVAASNLSVSGERARRLMAERKDLLILCSGREGKFALEDAYAAGRLATLALDGSRRRKGLNDAGLVVVDLARRYGESWERALTRSAAGRHLILSTRREDLIEATRQDAFPILPTLRDRRITVEVS